MAGVDDSTHRAATRLVTSGRSGDFASDVVNPPVWRASTHLYPDCAALRARKSDNRDGQFFYGRRGSPTQWALSEALTALEALPVDAAVVVEGQQHGGDADEKKCKRSGRQASRKVKDVEAEVVDVLNRNRVDEEHHDNGVPPLPNHQASFRCVLMVLQTGDGFVDGQVVLATLLDRIALPARSRCSKVP